jgi:hypothetical protein
VHQISLWCHLPRVIGVDARSFAADFLWRPHKRPFTIPFIIGEQDRSPGVGSQWPCGLWFTNHCSSVNMNCPSTPYHPEQLLRSEQNDPANSSPSIRNDKPGHQTKRNHSTQHAMPSHNATTSSPSGGGPAMLRPGNVRHQVAVTHSTFVGPSASSAQFCSPKGILKKSTGRPSPAAAPTSGAADPSRQGGATVLQRSTQKPTLSARDRAVGRHLASTKSPPRADSKSPSRADSVRVIVGYISPNDPPRTLRVVNGDVVPGKPAPSTVNQGSSVRPCTFGSRPAAGGRPIGRYPLPVDPRSTRFKEHLA